MLYLAIFVPPGQSPPPRDLIRQPELARYVQRWGRADDLGVWAIDQNAAIGAAWLRRWNDEDRGYGYIDSATPELSIAVVPEHRGHGVGTRLMENLLKLADRRFAAISLSVSPDNPAVRLYERFDFVVVARDGSSLIMLRPRST
jgi:ribosomal protein S18 acetylase RimI-like enzyme